ncbi:MAG: type VII secretion-associated serine protease mycosin, partial [Corynebacterium sp.]|nr:type VII secretion-associated serine protease mycosin [Corynebacterium sp.]
MKNPLFMNAIKTRLTATAALSTVLISTLTAATAVAPSGITPIAAAQNNQDCVATMLSSESALHEPTVIEKTLRFRQAWQLTTGA